jgi:polyisoprenoid-binding protein YceI
MRLVMLAATSIAVLGCAAYANSSSAPSSAAAETPVAPAPDLTAASKGAYAIDKGHGYIAFSYDHQGLSRPQLRWGSWDGTIDFDPAAPEKSSVSITIDAASIDSGVGAFNDHLKSADFFEVEKYPTIAFKSTKVERTGASTGKITGDLTIKTVTRPVVLDVKFNKAAKGRDGKPKLGFSGTTTVLRSDFGVDMAVPFVGDEVSIVIETEWSQK